MNRRSFFSVLAGVLPAAWVASKAQATRVKVFTMGGHSSVMKFGPAPNERIVPMKADEPLRVWLDEDNPSIAIAYAHGEWFQAESLQALRRKIFEHSMK